MDGSSTAKSQRASRVEVHLWVEREGWRLPPNCSGPVITRSLFASCSPPTASDLPTLTSLHLRATLSTPCECTSLLPERACDPLRLGVAQRLTTTSWAAFDSNKGDTTKP